MERYVNDVERDWHVYAAATLVPPDELDWHSLERALDEIGDDFPLDVHVGHPFIDYAALSVREGSSKWCSISPIGRRNCVDCTPAP